EHTAAGSMAALASVHGIAAEIVDGTDVLIVHARAAAAVGVLRDGGGPIFLECCCFPLDEPSRAAMDAWKEEMRRAGQYTSMLAFKTSKIGTVELAPPAHWLLGDPLRKLEQHVLTNGLAAESDLAAIRADVQHEIDLAVAFARGSAEPEASMAAVGVFA